MCVAVAKLLVMLLVMKLVCCVDRGAIDVSSACMLSHCLRIPEELENRNGFCEVDEISS